MLHGLETITVECTSFVWHLLQDAKTQEKDSTEYLSQLAGHYITLQSLLAVQDLHVDSLQGTAFLDLSLSSIASQQQHSAL